MDKKYYVPFFLMTKKIEWKTLGVVTVSVHHPTPPLITAVF